MSINPLNQSLPSNQPVNKKNQYPNILKRLLKVACFGFLLLSTKLLPAAHAQSTSLLPNSIREIDSNYTPATEKMCRNSRTFFDARECGKEETPVSREQGTIQYQKDFQGAEPGAKVFFMHENTFVQLGILLAQKIFHRVFFNVTHAAVVLNSTDETLCVAEAVRDGLTESCFSSRHIVGETICFDQPDSAASQETTKVALKTLQHQAGYDLEGAMRQSFFPKIFTKKQKQNLIRACIDHQFDASLSFPRKAYFCSQFVVETAQIAKLTQYIPNLNDYVEQEKKLIDPNKPSSRRRAIQRIMNRLDVDAIWKNVESDIDFSMPSESVSPADLFQMRKDASRMTCVLPEGDENQSVCGKAQKTNFHPFNMAAQELFEDYWLPSGKPGCLESLAVNLLKSHLTGNQVDMRSINAERFFAELSMATGYEAQLLQCLFESLQHRRGMFDILLQCFMSAIPDALSLVRTPFISRSLSHAMDRIQQNPDLLNLLTSEDSAKQEKAATTLFPYEEMTWDLPANIGILLSLQKNNPSLLFKYIPAALYYDPSILEKMQHIGMEKFYPVLEQKTGIKQHVWKCLNDCLQNPEILSCLSQCIKREISFIYRLADDFSKELKKIEDNPESWLIKALEEEPDFFNHFPDEFPYADLNQDLSNKTLELIAPLNNAKQLKKQLFPVALAAYVGTNPEQAQENLLRLASFENAKKVLSNEIISESSKKLSLMCIFSKITGLSYNTVACLVKHCSVNEEGVPCMIDCTQNNLSKKDAEQVRVMANYLKAKRDGKEVDALESMLSSLMHDNKGKKALAAKMMLAYSESSLSQEELTKIFSEEWEVLSSEEKTDFLLEIFAPNLRKYVMLSRLIANGDALKIAQEELRIGKAIYNAFAVADSPKD